MRCFVVGCKNGDKDKLRGISFHKIPTDRKMVWLNAIGRDMNTLLINQKICSEHFDKDDFFHGNIKLVKPLVVPKYKLPLIIDNISELQEETEPIGSASESVRPNKRQHSLDNETEGVFYDPQPPITSTSKRIKRVNSSSSSNSASTSSSIRRKRQLVKIFHDHNYSLPPEHYSIQILKNKKRGDRYKQRLNTCLKTSKRRKEKITHLKTVISDLRRKDWLSTSALEQLEKSFTGIPRALMERMLRKNRRGKCFKEKYPVELKRFAMTLQFYSDKAYRYVRKTFNLCLPAESTIRAWLSKVDCEPGFSSPSIEAISRKAECFFKETRKQLLCSLLLDEMSIKKEVTVDPATLMTRGYIDFGCDAENRDCELATEALVLMIVGVNTNFKLPIAYFFVNKLNGVEKANIVREAFMKFEETGARILSITCDGPKVHFNMMQDLGCHIKSDNIVPYFKHPLHGRKVFVFFDVCHMLKLVRNNWAKLVKFKNPNGEIVDWTYVVKLQQIQENAGLLLGNKLRKKHIQFHKAIMKVNLAAQTLSSSVADALMFLSEDLKLPQFRNVGPTVEFIRLIDRLFDLLNSRNPCSGGYKSPMRSSNEKFWRPFLENSIPYLKECRKLDNKLIINTQQQTPFIGFIVSSMSALSIFDIEVKEKESLKYLLTYKFSQDHLELFFCSVRSRNGWIVNPTCQQFLRSYKRLLIHNEIRNDSGNCVAQDQTDILTMSSTRRVIDVHDIHLQRKRNDWVMNMEKALDFDIPDVIPPELNEFCENVVAYIAGYIIRMFSRHSPCNICLDSLIDDGSITDEPAFKLIQRKSRGGLMYPSYDLRKLCMKTEKKIKLMYNFLNGKIPDKDTCLAVLLKDVNSYLLEGSMFNNLNSHVLDQELLAVPHKKILIEFVIRSYTKIRLHSLAKTVNENICGVGSRKVLSRLIIFRNQ